MPPDSRKRSTSAWPTIVGGTVGAGLVYLLGIYLLQDEVRQPLYDLVNGPKGCGQDGLQAIPALLMTYVASAILFTAYRTVDDAGRAARVIAGVMTAVAITISSLFTLLVLIMSLGIGCVA